MPARGRRGVGERGEEHALAALREAGYVLLDRNFYTRQGELDLVLEKAGAVVFVEVKARRTASLGPPEISVTPTKQLRIAAAARVWLAARGRQGAAMRFHVVCVDLASDGTARAVRILEDAFAPAERFPGRW